MQAQTVSGDDPTDTVDDAGGYQAGGGDDRQQGFATARCDRGEDIGDVGRFTSGKSAGDRGNLRLVSSEGTRRGGQASNS